MNIFPEIHCTFCVSPPVHSDETSGYCTGHHLRQSNISGRPHKSCDYLPKYTVLSFIERPPVHSDKTSLHCFGHQLRQWISITKSIDYTTLDYLPKYTVLSVIDLQCSQKSTAHSDETPGHCVGHQLRVSIINARSIHNLIITYPNTLCSLWETSSALRREIWTLCWP